MRKEEIEEELLRQDHIKPNDKSKKGGINNFYFKQWLCLYFYPVCYTKFIAIRKKFNSEKKLHFCNF